MKKVAILGAALLMSCSPVESKMSYSFTNCDNFYFQITPVSNVSSYIARYYGNPVDGCVKAQYLDIKITDYYIYTKVVNKYGGETNTTELYYSTLSYGFMLEIYK